MIIIVCVATPFQFVHYFATAACNNEAEAAMVAEEASQMMEMAQLDYNLAFFLPSTVAVAGVLCARSVVGLCPPMSPGLQQVMHIDFDFPESLDVDIRACCDILLRYDKKREEKKEGRKKKTEKKQKKKKKKKRGAGKLRLLCIFS